MFLTRGGSRNFQKGGGGGAPFSKFGHQFYIKKKSKFGSAPGSPKARGDIGHEM